MKKITPLDDARALVRGAERIIAFTGAGVSAESGIPTFADDNTLWRGYTHQDLASVHALHRNRRTILEWYEERRQALSNYHPNPAHHALARFFMERAAGANEVGASGLITQNVDGLHTRAAIRAAEGGDPAPARPIELHGALARDRCEECHGRYPARPLPPAPALPCCNDCGGPLRPDVVLFGEALDPNSLRRAQEMAHAADLCLSIGTRAEIYPAAAIPRTVLARGGHLIEINARATVLSPEATVVLEAPAGEAVPALLGM